MNASIVFDTLAYAKKLKSAGFTDAQAEVQAEMLAEVIEQQIASKRDLKETENNLKRDLKEMENNLKRDMMELEQRIVIKLGAMIAASIAITVSLLRFL